MTQPIRLASLMAAPAAGFEEPFGMLAACHERMQRMLALLARLRTHVASHGPDAQAQQAARDVMRYFDQAAPQHHRDEELHVFPPLLSGAAWLAAGAPTAPDGAAPTAWGMPKLIPTITPAARSGERIGGAPDRSVVCGTLAGWQKRRPRSISPRRAAQIPLHRTQSI